MRVIAKFKPASTSAYSAALILFSAYYLALPTLSGMALPEFMQSGRYNLWWPVWVPGVAWFLTIGLIIAYRLCFSHRAAVYINGDNLIVISPLLWRVKVADIIGISKYNRPGMPFPVDKILIQTRDGRKKYIGTNFLEEARDNIIGEIRAFRITNA